ncbi:MAG: trigger factor, partial [Lachnospiraceae bacterium]|nr:trigger factor [Lachnospiraceae bacterium]
MDNKKTKIKNIVIAVLAVVIIACVVILVVRINTNKKNQTGDTQTETQSTYTGKRSGQFEIDYAAQVTKLADYSAIPVELSNSYEVTDDSENEYLTSILTTYGADAYKQITDRD